MRQEILHQVTTHLEHTESASRALSLLRGDLLTEPRLALPILRDLSSDPAKLMSLVRSITSWLAQSPTGIHPFHIQVLRDRELLRALEGTKAQDVLRQSAQRLYNLSASCARTTASDLPPIPNDSVRATHFTSAHISALLMSGEHFSYSTQGVLSSTSDAFSCNNDVWQLVTTGSYGAFERVSFGPHVVIMDIQNTELRLHHSPHLAPGEVDNSRILGVFDCKSGTLGFNQRYDPEKPIQLERALDGRPLPGPAGFTKPPDSGTVQAVSREPPTPVCDTKTDTFEVW